MLISYKHLTVHECIKPVTETEIGVQEIVTYTFVPCKYPCIKSMHWGEHWSWNVGISMFSTKITQ